MPCRPHAEELAERRDLARRRQAADLRDVDADEVDQPFGNERQVLLHRVEQLAHRDRDARLLPQLRNQALSSGGNGSSRKNRL